MRVLLFLLFFFVHVLKIYAQNLQEGLIGHWSFDDAETTTVADAGTNNIEGQIINGSKINDGYFQKAVAFSSSSNGYIDLGKKIPSLLKGASQITFSCWINNVDHPSVRYDVFQTFTDNKVGFSVTVTAMGELTVAARSNDDDSYLSQAFNYTSYGIWTHVTAIVDYQNNSFEAYINATKLPVKVGDKPRFKGNIYNPTITTNTNFNDFIGGLKNSYNTFNGAIDEVRLYKRKLTEVEIYQLARPDLNPNFISPQDVERNNVEKIRQLMSGNIAFHNGKNHALVGDKRVFLNNESARIVPFRENDAFYIPISFCANHYESALENSNSSELTLTTKDGKVVKMAVNDSRVTINNVITDVGVNVLKRDDEFFVPLEVITLIYANSSYVGLFGEIAVIGTNISGFNAPENSSVISIMPDYFLPKNVVPKRNVRHNRNELLYLKPSGGRYVNNPTIVRMSDGTLIASCTSSGVGFKNYFYKSADGGVTWAHVSTVSGTLWATLFEHKNDLYLLGVYGAWGNIVIRRSIDKGETWSSASSCTIPGILFTGGASTNAPNHHSAPTAVIKANGRIYKAFEDNDPRVFPTMKTFIISASENSNLMDPASWTATEKLSVDFNAWKGQPYHFIQPGWLEGNAVQAPDGNIWNIIRVNSLPFSDKAAIQKMTTDGKKLNFNHLNDIIDFPGGLSKFSVKFDPKTRKYYSLVNNSVDFLFTGHRCVLSLSVSDDLVNWKLVEAILYDDHLNYWDDTLLKVGYQYVDFVFDGDNIVMVVRESWGDSANYHDANRFTSYILKDYAKYVN